MERMTALSPSASLGLPPLAMPGLVPIRCAEALCQDLDRAATKEWVVTNGLGGYASSTILGLNTRRYHGLLVAATSPPVGRVVILSKVEETLVLPGARYELATNQYASGVIHPEGYRYLVEFRLDPWPTFLYRIGDVLLEKSVFLLPGENAVVIGYTLHSSHGPVQLSIRPLIALRDFRWISQENSVLRATMEEKPGVLSMHPYEGLPPVMIHHNAELVERSPCWYKNFEYTQEEEHRGAVSSLEKTGGERIQEDLWSPGHLIYLLKIGESCALTVSTGRRGSVDLAFHERRLENTQMVLAQTMTPPGPGCLTTRLSWTADGFVARGLPAVPQPAQEREFTKTVVMAGFPWTSSWGRDALVSLPGLFLTTRRFDVARSILETLATQLKEGLIPVRLAEEDGSPEYDSADTSLWFLWAVWHYWKFSRDLKFVAKKLLDPMREIIERYLEGTSFGIRMDEDGLILLSDEELPLTWMDAREPSHRASIPGRAVTPRFGKPVEVNALWYCALSIMGTLGERLGLKQAATYMRLSRLVQQHFVRAFVSPEGILYDRITHTAQDASLRPNMLIAASLPFSPLPKARSAEVLAAAEKHLMTPVGVRTLSPRHPQYRGQYSGDLRSRALAYHQGTVWTWLIGPYVSAAVKVRGLTRSTKLAIKKQLGVYRVHLEERGLGGVSELFDGDAPHAPRGGISQAWSVGELLRAIHEARCGDL